MEIQENKHRKKRPQFKKGDRVYLYIKNLKTKRPSRKLDYMKVGPFLVKNVTGPVNYELQLPQEAKVYPVFHVLLLEKELLEDFQLEKGIILELQRLPGALGLVRP